MKFVADKTKIKLKGKSFGEIEVETEYPQFDSVDELTQSAGGATQLVDWANRIIKAQSKGRVLALNTTYGKDDNTTSKEVAEAKAKELRRTYTLAKPTASVSKADKANRFDEVSKQLSNINLDGASLEDIKAQLDALKALAAA